MQEAGIHIDVERHNYILIKNKKDQDTSYALGFSFVCML